MYIKGPFINTFLGGPDAKRRPLKVLTLLRGGVENMTTNIPGKIDFYGVDQEFSCQKGGGTEIFFRSERGSRKIFAMIFLSFLQQAPQQVSVNRPLGITLL